MIAITPNCGQGPKSHKPDLGNEREKKRA